MRKIIFFLALACATISCNTLPKAEEYVNVCFGYRYADTKAYTEKDVISSTAPNFPDFKINITCDTDTNDIYEIKTTFGTETQVPIGKFRVYGRYEMYKEGEFDGGVCVYDVPVLSIEDTIEFHSYSHNVLVDIKHESFCIMFREGDGVTDVQLRRDGEWVSAITTEWEGWRYGYIKADLSEWMYMKVVCDGTTDFQTSVMSINNTWVANGMYYIPRGGKILSAYFSFGTALYSDFTFGGEL